MRKLRFLLVMLFVAGAVSGQFDQARLQATGLTCAICSKAIQKALEVLPFVEKVSPDLKTSSFEINFRKNAVADADALRMAVEEAGFFVGRLTLRGQFEALPISAAGYCRIGKQHYRFLNAGGRVLSGQQTIQLQEKHFLTIRDFKKISGRYRLAGLETGKADKSFEKESVPEGSRLFHVIL